MFKDTGTASTQVVEKGLVQNQVPAVDQPLADLRLLVERNHAPFHVPQLAESTRRPDRGHGGDSRMRLVKSEGLAHVHVDKSLTQPNPSPTTKDECFDKTLPEQLTLRSLLAGSRVRCDEKA